MTKIETTKADIIKKPKFSRLKIWLKNFGIVLPKKGLIKILYEKLSNTIDLLNPFEEKRDYFATSVLSECENLQFDTEGRVSFSQKLLSHAKITNNILFVGLGKTFQIWEPKNFEKFKVMARKKAFQNRSNLKWENKQKGDMWWV